MIPTEGKFYHLHNFFESLDYETVEEYINAIIEDHNNYRPSYALKYKTPIEYRTQLGFQ